MIDNQVFYSILNILVKRGLGEVSYVVMFKRNLISLCRLEAKGRFFKASCGSLKVITRSMVLMK